MFRFVPLAHLARDIRPSCSSIISFITKAPVAALSAIALVSACGGGGGSSAPTPSAPEAPPPPPPPPQTTLQITSEGTVEATAAGLALHAISNNVDKTVYWRLTGPGRIEPLGDQPLGREVRYIPPDANSFDSPSAPITVTITAEIVGWNFATTSASTQIAVTPGTLPGRLWTTLRPAAPAWSTLGYDNGLFVAGSSEGLIWSSSDGKTWTERAGANGDGITSMAFGQAGWVAITAGGGSITSRDGVEWVKHAAKLGASWEDRPKNIAAGNGVYVAGHYVSADGVTWNSVDSLIGKVTFGNGRFVSAGPHYPMGQVGVTPIQHSADGVHWSVPTTDITPYISNYDVAFANGHFALLNFNEIWTSLDGSTWANEGLTQLQTGDQMIVAANQFLTIGTPRELISGDGVKWYTAGVWNSPELPAVGIASNGHGTWVRASSTGAIETGSYVWPMTETVEGSVGALTGVATMGNTTVAVGDRGFALRSTGGGWTREPLNRSIPGGLPVAKAVVSGPERFVATGQLLQQSLDGSPPPQPAGGFFAWSADGTDWHLSTTPRGEICNALTWDGNRFAAGCEAGNVYVSPDGSTWTLLSTVPGQPYITGIARGAGNYVAISHSFVAVSPDGTNWSRIGIPANMTPWPLNSVAWDGSRFVAVGDWGSVRVSSDGSTWTYDTVPDADLYGVWSAHGLFVAVGGKGVHTSRDGHDWKARPGTTGWNSLRAVTATPDGFIAVGDQSRIILSTQ